MPVVPLLILGVAIGALLGLLGAGGSILAVPGLIAVLGIPVSAASLSGAIIVGSAAVAGIIRRRATEPINVRAGLTFGATGLVGTIFGARVASVIDERIILYAFSLLILFAAVAMLRSSHPMKGTQRRPLRSFVIASLVGALTGLFGIGGGFMIVPALVLGMGITVQEASGASLVTIALNSGIALLMRSDQWSAIQVGPVALVGIAAIAVSAFVAPLSGTIPAQTLRKGFAMFLVAVSIYLAVK